MGIMTISSYKVQDSPESQYSLKSQITFFMYRSECQSKGVLHIHKAFLMNEDIDMKENKVQEKIFKELENVQGNEKKVQEKMFKEFNVLQGNCYFHFIRNLIHYRRKTKMGSSSQMLQHHCKNGKIDDFEEFHRIAIRATPIPFRIEIVWNVILFVMMLRALKIRGSKFRVVENVQFHLGLRLFGM
jgi:hypothetical protein